MEVCLSKSNSLMGRSGVFEVWLCTFHHIQSAGIMSLCQDPSQILRDTNRGEKEEDRIIPIPLIDGVVIM